MHAQDVFEEVLAEPFYDSHDWLPGPPGSNSDDSLAFVDDPIVLDEAAPAYSSGHWLFSGGWYVQADAVVLLKTKLNFVPLAVDASVAGSPLVLTTQTASPTYEPGARVTAGRVLGRDPWNRDHVLEYRFFGLFDWQSQARVVRTFDANAELGIQTLLGPNVGDVAALYGNTVQRYVETSTLDSYEFNYRIRTRSTRDRMVLQHDGHWIRHTTCSRIWSCFAGVARFSIDEQFDLRGFGPETTRGRYVVSTANDIVGIQIGGEYMEQAALWHWGLRGRLGGLHNFAQRRILFESTVDPIGPEGPTAARRGEVHNNENMVFLIEGGLFAALQLHPNTSIRAGYDILYLTGLAQATGSLGLPVDNFPPLRVTDDAIYHGGSIGLTVVW